MTAKEAYADFLRDLLAWLPITHIAI